jgi:hypothetical protein
MVYQPPSHGILTPLPMKYRPPYPWYFDPLPMVYRPPYPWYFDPLTHGISTPLSMEYRPPTHGISTPLSMEYRPPTHDILISLPISWLEMGGQNTMGIQFTIQGESVFNKGVQYTMDENWPRGQFTMGLKIPYDTGPMIFGRVMAVGLWNLAKYLVVTTFFRYAWRYWLDVWYMSV